ncbi:MAG TPA: hypothetical protein VNG33_02110 [Polyangiaceae bacterium]|nr:hypothetical protein [Polyangiaceae bacterium]
MAEREPPQHSDARAKGTLLGVPAPRVESNADSPLRSPVFVRSGTSIADVEPAPLPRMALPSRPPVAGPGVSPERDASARFAEQGGLSAWALALAKLPVRGMGSGISLGMVLVPALGLWLGLVCLLLSLKRPEPAPSERIATGSSATAPEVSAPAPTPVTEKPSSPRLSELAGKSPESLSAKELVLLAEGRADEQRTAVKALRAKIEASPAALQDKAVQAQLLHFVGDGETARDALSALAAGPAPLGPDLLYEVWTGTTQRTDATDLARALVYSTDVRPKASAALSVALQLRVAESCESYKAILPKALKDGDRRALHLLVKLNAKRGCGPKKTDDCYACLRDDADELTATINAVKSRRAPSYVAP